MCKICTGISSRAIFMHSDYLCGGGGWEHVRLLWCEIDAEMAMCCSCSMGPAATHGRIISPSL